MVDLQRYHTIIFDCDGVILDSNKTKTEAFFNAALPYGEKEANQLVAYHKENGGVSRYRKFEYFLNHIVGIQDHEKYQLLLDAFAEEVRKGMLNCAASHALMPLKKLAPSSNWAVVSGSDQAELRDVFKERKIDKYFGAGIFGSPESKDEILRREFSSGNFDRPSLFIGDSRYDHESAVSFDLDFLFVSAWSEFTDWKAYQVEHGFRSVHMLSDILHAEE